MKNINLLLILLLPLIISCKDIMIIYNNLITKKKADQDIPIARVQEKYLYFSDIEKIVAKEKSPKDSISIVTRYIQSWIRKQLMLSKAKSIDMDKDEIERKMQEYQYALIVYEYQKKYIKENLDTSITDKEIGKYYKANLVNFELKQNIIKGRFIIIPVNAPKISQLKKWVKSDKSEELKELKSYCYRFATKYSLEDSLWFNFDEVIQNTPFKGIPNKVQFLHNNRYIETQDSNFVYILKINDYKIMDQISPLEFVKGTIKNIIINKRKVDIVGNLEETIYKRAILNDEFEIYN